MLIAETIQEWIEDPSQLTEEGLDPPTAKALHVALALGQIILPMRVVPNGDGGVTFEWRSMTQSLEIGPDGSLDFIVWKGTEIETRMQWNMKA